MFNAPSNKKAGLINLIILVVISVLILSYYGFDIKSIAESPQSQTNFEYIRAFVVDVVWKQYLSEPILYFWNNIFIKLLWESFVNNMEKIKRGEPSDIQSWAPAVTQYGTQN